VSTCPEPKSQVCKSEQQAAGFAFCALGVGLLYLALGVFLQMACLMSQPAPSPLFSGHGLSCIRGDRVVFNGLDFACAAGEAILLLGRNGSGKSSLLRLMGGLVQPAAGRLAWQGESVHSDREAHGLRCRYIGHADAIKPVLTVAENIAFWVRLWAPQTVSTTEALDHCVEQALERFSMGRLRDVPGRFLSAGQKRRVNLARLFAAPGQLWLLDEPTTALDKASIEVLEQAIADHRAAGGLVVLSTHTDVVLPQATVMQMETFAPTLDAVDAQWLGESLADDSEDDEISWDSLRGER
jgi:heme exporter protein A